MKNRLSFFDHLEELRKGLIVCLVTIGVFSVVAYFFSKTLLDFLIQPLNEYTGTELYFHAPYEAFVIRIKIALLAGLVGASPVIFTQIWLFMAPGLHQREKRILFPLIFISCLLFLGGAAFAFWVIIPFGLKFLLGFETESLRPLLGVSPYFSFLLAMIIACGVVFDLPVVVLGLALLGIVNAQKLRSSRKVLVVTSLILAAVLTPTPDPLNQLLVALPLILLYEICIWIAVWFEKRKKK
ncbi:MAG: twin-arginine translocase subunit TatC [Candidatus Omnitrophica bacterium]|nr:twin-arginine translocase subunit TatC [Candidatus Omnitrophota bacterium]